MPGFIRRAIEGTLTTNSDDDRYWRSLGYVFELITPTSRKLMPILLGPTEYRFTRDFAHDTQMAQDGAIHVEEGGIITGRISLTVDPGVSPRATLSRVATGAEMGPPSAQASRSIVGPLSGHRRWMQIRDELFLEYSRLKKNTRDNTKTALVFHSLKDDTSYYVVPTSLALNRTAQEATRYPYTVELLAVGEYAGERPTVSGPDRSLLAAISAPAQTIRAGIEMLTATVDDVSYYLQQASFAAQSWTNVIAATGRLIESSQDFLSGAEAFLRIPIGTVTALADALDKLTATADDWASLDLDARRWWRDMERQVDRIRMLPGQFSEDLNSRVAKRRRLGLGAAAYSPAELAAAPGGIGGSGARSSDALRAAAQSSPADPGGRNGFIEIVVTGLDTPDGLAARYGVPWSEVAIANGLRAPYISDAGLPGTVAPGDRITIPVRDTAERYLTADAPGDGSLGTSRQEELFGRDILLDDLQGIAIDRRYGSLDFATVGGVDNVVQGIGIRIQTTRGHNPLYPDFGRQDYIGRVTALEQRLMAEVDTRRSLLADPRVRSVALSVGLEGDTMATTVDLVLSDRSTVRAQGRL